MWTPRNLYSLCTPKATLKSEWPISRKCMIENTKRCRSNWLGKTDGELFDAVNCVFPWCSKASRLRLQYQSHVDDIVVFTVLTVECVFAYSFNLKTKLLVKA